MHQTVIGSRYIERSKLRRLLFALFGENWELEEDVHSFIITTPRALVTEELHQVSSYRDMVNEAAFSRQVERLRAIDPVAKVGRPKRKPSSSANKTPIVGDEEEDLANIPLANSSTNKTQYGGDEGELANVPLVGSSNADGYFRVPGLKLLSEKDSTDVEIGPLNEEAGPAGVAGWSWEPSLIPQEDKPAYSSVYRGIIRWNSLNLQNEPGLKTMKVARKVLPKETPIEQFLVEFEAYRKTMTSGHPNLVVLLQAFRSEQDGVQEFNFVFPLAIGTMKHMFRGSLNISAHSESMESLWSQFEGLSSALEYLHDECNTAHRDIKPSNILLYQNLGDTSLTAKIADFGLATNLRGASTWTLGTIEAQSALEYDAPEVRRLAAEYEVDPFKLPQPKELVRNDVWKMGCIFILLLTFLQSGKKGVSDFERLLSRSHRHYKFDDGDHAKPEVLKWTSDLAIRDKRASEMVPLLHKMLGSPKDRPVAKEVTKMLRLMSFCQFSDGTNNVCFSTASQVPPLHFTDRCKESIEKVLRSDVHWWPLRQGFRSLPENRIRVTWKSYKSCLYVDVPSEVALEYRKKCVPISQPPGYPAPTDGPPNYQSHPQYPGNTYQRADRNRPGYSRNSAHSNEITRSTGPTTIDMSAFTGDADNQGSRTPSDQTFRELYWCVDIAWLNQRFDLKRTRLCIVPNESLDKDKLLLLTLKAKYQTAQGFWRRFFSWKEVTRVEFIKFYTINKKTDGVIRDKVGLPTDNMLYDWVRQETQSVEMHQRMAAAEIISGMGGDSDIPDDSDEILKKIPKRKYTTPLAERTEGWGIHGLLGWSLPKILAWIIVFAIVGISFAIFWLVKIDHKGIPAALAPFGALMTILTVKFGFESLLTTPVKVKEE